MYGTMWVLGTERGSLQYSKPHPSCSLPVLLIVQLAGCSKTMEAVSKCIEKNVMYMFLNVGVTF